MKKNVLFLALLLSSFSISLSAQDATLKTAQGALMAKDYKSALTNFTTYIGSFQNELDAYLKKKFSYDTSNAFTKTTQFADFKINHTWATGFYGRGIANLNLEQKDDALKDFETAIKIDPSYAEAYYLAALLKKIKGDKTGSCMYIGKALTYNDTMKLARNAYRDNFCWMCGMEFYKKGKMELDLKEYPDALGDFRMAVTVSPDSGNYFGYMGMCFDGVGKLDSALLAFAKAIKLDSNSYSAYYYRGLVNEEKQKYQDAFNDLSKAIKIRPNSADAYMHRASVCENMDKESSAIYDYQQIIRIKPNNGDAYYKVALYREKLGQDACDYFQKALDNGVDDAQSYVDACRKAEEKKIHK
jgi:tetratricopeptide (TPR) repeat protein